MIMGIPELVADARRIPRRAWSASVALPPTVRCAAGEVADVYLYGDIGWPGISPESVLDGLRHAEGLPLRVHINSRGGDAFDGLAIYNTLRSYAAPVETIVEGLAASAASIIAMAGEPLRMARASLLMVHEPWGVVMGTAADMLDLAAVLEKAGGVLADVYAEKSGASRKRVREWMAAETWFTADEAEAAKLTDGTVDERADALAARSRFDLSAYRNTPAALRGAIAPEPDTAAALAAQREWLRERQAAVAAHAA